MKIKNDEVEAFSNFLMSFDLVGRESRLRTKFVKFLMERVKYVKEEHAELIRQFAKFEENGDPIIVEVNGNKAYDVPDRATFNKEYFILLNEDFIIEENEERKEMLMFIKDIILNCQKTFNGREALEYDIWCECVEDIKYD
jgi:hypothetical protein